MAERNLILKSEIQKVYRTQEDFAEVAQEDPTFVSRVVNGRRPLTRERQIRWAKLLRADVSYLFPAREKVAG